MRTTDGYNFEDIMLEYMDKIKYLISPELWNNDIFNCSKNELFVLLFLYRKENANMTQIAEYLCVPLNTATGIVARMEKKDLLCRMRSKEDKRVVHLMMTETGKQEIQTILNEITKYGTLIFESFTTEEVKLTLRLLDKAMYVLSNRPETQLQEEQQEKKIRKIVIE